MCPRPRVCEGQAGLPPIQAAAFRVWSGDPSSASPQQLPVVGPSGFQRSSPQREAAVCWGQGGGSSGQEQRSALTPALADLRSPII